MAMTPTRRAKKAENQRIGQSSKYDIHHIGGKVGKTSKTSVAKNRGGHGKGTRKRKKMTALMNTGDFIALITILIVLLAGVSALHVIIKDKKE